MNAGAQALARVKEPLSAIAAKLSPPTTRQAVGLWRKGKTLPSNGYRIALETLYGIPRSAWDPLLISAPDATSEAPKSRVVAEGAAVDELRTEVGRYERLLSALEASDATSGRTYVSALAGKVAALSRLARLEASRSATEARVWRTVLDRLAPILEAHPDVAGKVAAALEVTR